MPKDDEMVFLGPQLQDARMNLRREDLVRDATSMVQQALQFYLPDEVEVTVCLSFRGDLKAVAVSTSVTEAERLKWQLRCALDRVPNMNLRAKGERGKIIT